MATNQEAITLAKRLITKQKLDIVEKLILEKRGWIKMKEGGFTLTPLAKAKLTKIKHLLKK